MMMMMMMDDSVNVFQGDPMRIVYRMRGLLGDATEDMVNSLDTGKGNKQKLSIVRAQC